MYLKELNYKIIKNKLGDKNSSFLLYNKTLYKSEDIKCIRTDDDGNITQLEVETKEEKEATKKSLQPFEDFERYMILRQKRNKTCI